MNIDSFIEAYSKALKEKNAAVFAGAGFSMEAGYVNWKQLLSSVAKELKLEVDKEEHDLVSLAQYYYNENNGRGILNQIIVDQFRKKANVTENHRILATLPIETFWTTNYDSLIEQALTEHGKLPDIKIEPEHLAVTVPNRNAIVYKMHGDVSHVHKTVITRDDYERYETTNRSLFTTTLKGDLLSKTFLFIGFSFNDPNLNYILSRIRISLEGNQRPHYCIMRKVNRKDYTNDEEYNYEVVKQELRINDLKRFAIQTLLIDEYSQVTEILKRIEIHYRQNNIFISGSAEEYGSWGSTKALKFAHQLSKELIKLDYTVVTGFGLGIGSAVITGALEEIHSSRARDIDANLVLRPFPQIQVGDRPLSDLWYAYRKEMISNAGIAVFIFGNRLEDKTIIDAPGVESEFRIALENGLSVIPVGATGYMSKRLWDIVKEQFLTYYPNCQDMQECFDSLGDSSLEPEVLIKRIIELVERLRRN